MAFTRYSIAIFFMMLVSMSAVTAQKKSPNKARRLPVANNNIEPIRLPIKGIDDTVEPSIQYEMRHPEEVEGDATRDVEFEDEITSNNNGPKLPSKGEVREVYNSQIYKIRSEAKEAGDDSLSTTRISVNPMLQYYSLEFWQKPILKCCPRAWNYQCRSSDIRHPCFYQYFGKVREWCCPIWPSVMIKRCMCSQCAVLTNTCAHQGRCQSRYSKRSFLAVCYRNNQWGFLRYITKYLPSSCYCRI